MAPPEQPKRTYASLIRTIVFIIGCILMLMAALVWILSLGNVISGIWSSILPIIFVVLGVIFTFGQFLFALSPSTSNQSNASLSSQPVHVAVTVQAPTTPQSPLVQPAEQQTDEKTIWSRTLPPESLFHRTRATSYHIA